MVYLGCIIVCSLMAEEIYKTQKNYSELKKVYLKLENKKKIPIMICKKRDCYFVTFMGFIIGNFIYLVLINI